MAKGLGHELEARTLDGLQVDLVHKGLIRCRFLIPKHLSDGDGNWHVGAMATLIDVVGAAAVSSFAGHIKASVDFNLSYFSTAKIHEEVEVEAKVVGQSGRLVSVTVEVKKKENGKMIALGRQWITTIDTTQPSSSSSKL
ncbi:hypothetical protein RJ640_008592 [Escallonia rubra]|uniref:Acyl-coenzyme A thioesterase 13 n=1 Tax=Escallonia rubra TaxID=112253 RepID=A0AA88QQH0_9ASTE|nr:hypothetical protein RJ640_008592 [Escallonia rubra]